MSRTDRIKAVLQAEISEILRERVSDPRIGFVSITEVDISPDLKNAKIYFSMIAGSEKEKSDCLAGLKSATRFVRGELGPRLSLRSVPSIEFVYDNSLERGSNVISIINKIDHGSDT
ncbi:MAG: 30S ribosome-binding factor RbfA [Candidatus Margulisiibacteriota bacterium]